MMQAQIIVDRFLRKEHSYSFMLNAFERLLLVMLASYAGNKTNCFPSHQSLSRDCGMSTDSVKRSLKSLENKYLVKILRSKGSNNHYELTIPSADSTEGSQHLEANSTTYPVPPAPTPSADSPPNNISNNIKKCTSVNIREVETSPDDVSKINYSASKAEIFSYWQETMNHPRAKLDKKREGVIHKALQLGYSVVDLKLAIEGCAQTPFNMGQNDRQQIYDDISLILRDAEHIERFINNANNPPNAKQINNTNNNIMSGVL